MDCGQWSSDSEEHVNMLGGFEWFSMTGGPVSCDSLTSSGQSENDASDEQSWDPPLDDTSDTNSWAETNSWADTNCWTGSEGHSTEWVAIADHNDGCAVSSDPGLVGRTAKQDPLPRPAAAAPLMQAPGSTLTSAHGSTWERRQGRASGDYLLPAQVGTFKEPLLPFVASHALVEEALITPACPVDNQDGRACPMCARPCLEPHRLGKYWRKFGYNGKSCASPLRLRDTY